MKPSDKVKYISNWILEYVDSYPARSLLIGISGGIDSSVSSTLSAMTGIKQPFYIFNQIKSQHDLDLRHRKVY